MKKIFVIFITIALVLLSVSMVGNAGFVKQNIIKETVFKNDNKQIKCGEADIYGDGTAEENTIVDMNAEIDLSIGISSKTEIVDFYVDYSITCDGQFDDGRVYFLLQVDGVSQELQDVSTQDTASGSLVLEDVEVNRGDIITFEIGGAYTNLNPAFVVPDADFGGGVISKNKVFHRAWMNFPFLNSFINRFFNL